MKNNAILNKLEPKIFPMTYVFTFTNNVEVKEVNNSGKEVTAASKIAPKKAPETFVF